MTSMFDYDDSVNLVFEAKTAGKNIITAKHELLTQTGEFLFLAHSDKEFAFRCQMIEEDIERVARRRMATVSDSKAKLVRALHEEWKIRHANCQMCKLADSHNFGDNVGSCASCKGNTGHKSSQGWHCPSGAGCQSRKASKADKADKDYDGDGELESSEEEHAGAVDKAIKEEKANSAKSSDN